MLPIIAVHQILQCILFPLAQSRTDLGHNSLSSHCISHISLPHHASTFSHIYPLGGQGRHVWQIVRQLPMKTGWWDAPLAIWDLAVSNLHNQFNCNFSGKNCYNQVQQFVLKCENYGCIQPMIICFLSSCLL